MTTRLHAKIFHDTIFLQSEREMTQLQVKLFNLVNLISTIGMTEINQNHAREKKLKLSEFLLSCRVGFCNN